MYPLAILSTLEKNKASGKKMLAMLLDPDKVSLESGIEYAREAERMGVDWLMIGGSLTQDLFIQELIPSIQAEVDLPLVIFPGSPTQIVASADAIMLLSLISGRNPDFLIGRHVEAAPLLKKSPLEVIPTGYMLIESGRMTTVNYISNTLPIPRDKADIAMSTALAGELLGLKMIYMDGGSGALEAVPAEMIQRVSKELSIPLIVGGGIRSGEQAQRAWYSGADMIVVGSAFEKEGGIDLLSEICALKNQILQ